MKKKIVFWTLVLFLVVQSAVPVKAAPEEQLPINIRTVSGYCMDEELYFFCRLNENYDADSFSANLTSEQAASAERDKKLTPITESSSIVRYLFLVDRSGTMRRYTKEVNRFVEAIMEQEQQKFFCTIASFGERFDIIQADMTDKNTVKTVLEGLKYNELKTDPYSGVLSALTYLDGSAVRSGDLINLIVITDGDPDLADENKQREQELADSALNGIRSTPEVIVSTFCTASWDETAGAVFGAGKGIHAQVSGEQQAAEAGSRMVSYVDSLYRMNFRLTNRPQTERFQTTLRFKGKNLEGNTERFEESVENVPNLKKFSNSAQGGTEEPSGSESASGGESEDTVNSDTEDGTQAPGSEAETQADGTEDGTQTPDTEDGTQDQETVKVHSTLVLLLVGGVIICALLVILICVLCRRGKRGHSGQTASSVPAGNGIPVKVEVYAGRCPKAGTVMMLNGELLIGSSSECDLVFSEQTVSPKNSRVFMRDAMVYIEDLNSAEGTALCGMRIQGQNRLRSGDVISIGNVEFCLKF